MKKKKESYCPLCGQPLQREERPVVRKRAAFYCADCDQIFTKEMSVAMFEDSSERKITATVVVGGDIRLSRNKKAMNEALKDCSLNVSNGLLEITIKNIRL